MSTCLPPKIGGRECVPATPVHARKYLSRSKKFKPRVFRASVGLVTQCRFDLGTAHCYSPSPVLTCLPGGNIPHFLHPAAKRIEGSHRYVACLTGLAQAPVSVTIRPDAYPLSRCSPFWLFFFSSAVFAGFFTSVRELEIYVASSRTSPPGLRGGSRASATSDGVSVSEAALPVPSSTAPAASVSAAAASVAAAAGTSGRHGGAGARAGASTNEAHLAQVRDGTVPPALRILCLRWCWCWCCW